MKRTFVALLLGFIFLVPVTGWSAQTGGTLPEQVASLAAQVAELQGLVANLTTQLNNEVTAYSGGYQHTYLGEGVHRPTGGERSCRSAGRTHPNTPSYGNGY